MLISIQSLILVEEPYFNEPGYEMRPGQQAASRSYNAPLREATIQWAMVDSLRNPPAEFAPVIRTHFRLRGAAIMQQIDRWIGEATGAHAAQLKTHQAVLQAELDKLAAA